MKNIILKILLPGAILILAASPLSAQVTWSKTYGGSYDELCHNVRQTADGGYVATGLTYSFGKMRQLYVFKTDSAGTLLWQKNFGSNADDEGYSILQTGDGGYLVAGWTKSYGPGLPAANVYLLKLNAAGDTAWTRCYGGDGEDCGYLARQTPDGGYIVAGSTTSWGAGAEDVLLMKLDAAGDTMWTRTYGGVSNDQGFYVDCTYDGGYIIAGTTFSCGSGTPDSSNLFLIRTDSLGDTLWTRSFGGIGREGGWCARSLPAGGFVAVGWSTMTGVSETDLYLVRTDGNGDTLWTRCLGGPGSEDGFGVEPVADGGYIITGHTSSYGAGGTDVYLVKTDSLGVDQWTRTFGGPQWDFGESIQLTADGGIIIGGFTWSFGQGTPTYCNAYLIKTDRDGTMGVEEARNRFNDLPGRSNTKLQVWPNPFRLGTIVRYALPCRSQVRLAVYDITGRKVRVLADEIMESGRQEVAWDGLDSGGRRAAAGVYFVRGQCNSHIDISRMTLIK